MEIKNGYKRNSAALFVEMEKTKNFGSSLIQDTANKYDYENPREKAFLKRLAEGTPGKSPDAGLCHQRVFQNADEQNETADPQSAAPVGLSNFVYGHRADSAACNEAVRLAKKKGL